MCFLGLEGSKGEAVELKSIDSSVDGVSGSSVDESAKEDVEVTLRGARLCKSDLSGMGGGDPGGVISYAASKSFTRSVDGNSSYNSVLSLTEIGDERTGEDVILGRWPLSIVDALDELLSRRDKSIRLTGILI